jgi:hypothetical protein
MNYTYVKMKCSSVTLLVNLSGVGIIGPEFYTKAILANFFVRGKVLDCMQMAIGLPFNMPKWFLM